MQGMQRTREVVNDMDGIYRVIWRVKIEACFGPCVACVSLAYGAIRRHSPHVDVQYNTCFAVSARTSMYGDVQCRKARSCCVRRRILHACRRRMATCGNVRCRTSTQDTADAKIICYRNLLQHVIQIELLFRMLHPSTYDDAVCVNVSK